MSIHCHAAWLSVLLALTTVPHARGGEAVTQDRLHAVITRSLGFLAKDGDRWIEEKSCNGCHHMPVLLWSHREAKRRGFAIDQAKLNEWIEWSDSKVVNAAPGLEQAGLMLLALPEKPPLDATKAILKGQQADGSWKPAGQFADMQRRNRAEAQGNAARLFLLALAASDVGPPVVEETRKKAAAWVENAEPPKSVETLVFRALYARRFGKPEEVDAVSAAILKLQHADGGWAYIVGEAASDALGTGQVLYWLGEVPGVEAAGAVERGRNWLLSTQREDGSWPAQSTLFSKVDRSGPTKASSLKNVTDIYTYWGSAWATIGLLQAVPLNQNL